MKTAGDFSQVNSLTLLKAPAMSTAGTPDPCAGATPACPTLATYTKATDVLRPRQLVLKEPAST